MKSRVQPDCIKTDSPMASTAPVYGTKVTGTSLKKKTEGPHIELVQQLDMWRHNNELSNVS